MNHGRTFNEEFLKEDNFNYPVSFNGKMRFNIELPVDMPKEEIIKEYLPMNGLRSGLETALHQILLLFQTVLLTL